jgi:uncharacterized protein YjbI with pentapeptide repeats
MPRGLKWTIGIAIAIVALAALAALPVVLPPRMWVIAGRIKRLPDGVIDVIAGEVALVGLAIFAAVIWFVWWRLPQRQIARLALKIRDPKARADTEDNFRKTIGQALGGAAVLIGAVVAYLQFTQQQRTAHDLLISNQVAKGFEQLGSDKTVVRLGGIYGLEGVMNTSMEYHQPVLEALCAFVRDGTIGKTLSDHPTTDIQAALTVIGRRADGPGRVNFAGANLSGADLTDVKLAYAGLEGANLEHAVLFRADLERAGLFRANLEHAVLFRANLTGALLFRTKLTGAELTYADLTDASGLTQGQLDEACGTGVKGLPPDLHLDKPCLPPPPPPQPAP